MKIESIRARQIFDSRGLPTIECELVLDTQQSVIASVPNGLSTARAEGFVLHDQDARLSGLGVDQAITIIETIIAPFLVNKEPNLIQMDAILLELDNTADKSHLGANSMIAVSTAICKAQALIEQMPLYQFIAAICEIEVISIPFGMFNIINGGMHADNNLLVQEIMVMPVGMSMFKEAIEMAVELFQALKDELHKKGKSVMVGDEGGFAPCFKDEKEALDILMEVIIAKGFQESILLGLDMAASRFYNPVMQHYMVHGVPTDSYQLIEWYQMLSKDYPLYALEDGLSELDWNGWKELTTTLGSSLQLIGDDIFATNPRLIWQGIEQSISNAVLIKPTQIGTITETLQAVRLCHEYERSVVVSHRSGETNDTFIADLAVGCNASQIKAGGCSRGERMAKYNRLLAIEEELLMGS